jgi:hypothetical protein
MCAINKSFGLTDEESEQLEYERNELIEANKIGIAIDGDGKREEEGIKDKEGNGRKKKKKRNMKRKDNMS